MKHENTDTTLPRNLQFVHTRDICSGNEKNSISCFSFFSFKALEAKNSKCYVHNSDTQVFSMANL